ncbi:hypothetical protein HUJ05_002191 [Dendroctonus ponderosae]|nr:hypothetical protein HUJ05_002191 [Dendroctonus ponderosae]
MDTKRYNNYTHNEIEVIFSSGRDNCSSSGGDTPDLRLVENVDVQEINLNKTFSISNRLQRKRKVTNGQDELVQKKCKLIDFQMECMRNEEEKNRKT